MAITLVVGPQFVTRPLIVKIRPRIGAVSRRSRFSLTPLKIAVVGIFARYAALEHIGR